MSTPTRTFASTITLLALTACNPSGELNEAKKNDIDDGASSARALHTFRDCADMKNHLVDTSVEQVVQARYGYGWWGFMEGDVAVDGAVSESGDASGPTDYTTTNVQEAGVDEDDFVKTDGNFVYVVQDDEFFVVKSWPADEADIIARVQLSGSARSMFVEGDKAVVFQYAYRENENQDFFRDWSGTTMTFIDLANRSNAHITRTVDLEGWFQSGRMIDGQVYAVTNSSINVPYEVWDLAWRDDLGLPSLPNWDAPEDQRAAAAAAARLMVRPFVQAIYDDLTIDDLMPRVRVDGGQASPMHQCTAVYEPPDISQPAVLSVSHFDLTASQPVLESTGLMADGWTVYASEDNLYVAQSSWWSWWGWGDLDMGTDIHKFALNGRAPAYLGSGTVDGWILDQFSMSEYNGDLRVATTSFDWWWGSGTEEEEGGNNLFVLREEGHTLRQIGEVTGLAPNEQIYAVRMLGDTGYMVTYEQVDPLWTIDLSDPRRPRVLGELELPGYSAYLHPLDADHLLAVGMDGDWNGGLDGLAVNIFDVSDLSRPRLAHQFTLPGGDWSWSEALWDHHAFTFHNGKLSIPIYTYDYDYNTGSYDNFSGLLVLDVDVDDGLTEVGRVDHSDLVAQSECRYGYAWYCSPDEYYWYANMRRSLYIEDNLFSVSDYGIKVNKLNRPERELARVVFNPR